MNIKETPPSELLRDVFLLALLSELDLEAIVCRKCICYNATLRMDFLVHSGAPMVFLLNFEESLHVPYNY